MLHRGAGGVDRRDNLKSHIMESLESTVERQNALQTELFADRDRPRLTNRAQSRAAGYSLPDLELYSTGVDDKLRNGRRVNNNVGNNLDRIKSANTDISEFKKGMQVSKNGGDGRRPKDRDTEITSRSDGSDESQNRDGFNFRRDFVDRNGRIKSEHLREAIEKELNRRLERAWADSFGLKELRDSAKNFPNGYLNYQRYNDGMNAGEADGSNSSQPNSYFPSATYKAPGSSEGFSNGGGQQVLGGDFSSAPAVANNRSFESNKAQSQGFDYPAPGKISDSAIGNHRISASGNIQDLSIAGPPTISAKVIDEVLYENGSPVAGMGQEIFDRSVAAGIDPAIALGFFSVESTYGTAGSSTQTLNWGNIRSGPNSFRSYGSWMESLDDWLNLMNNEYLNSNGFNVQTVDQAIPIYAPASDGNDTSVYINAVRSRVSEWRQREAQDPESDLNAGSSDLVSSKFDEFINADGVPVIEGSAFPVVGYSADSVPLHHSQSAGASDLMAPRGTPIVSFRTGTVSFSGWDNTGGWSVMMQNDDGTEAYYAHMNSQPVAQAGQRVEAGELIGEVGNTGNAQATDPHLHFAFGTGGINLGAGPNGGAYLSTNVVGELDELLSLSRLAGDWSTV